ncbi:MAG: ComEC/Rec2 family competence protein [Christensenellaceae bacterium]
MANKQKRKPDRKALAGIIISILCIIGIILIFAFGTQGNFIDNIKNIWENTIHSGRRVDAAEFTNIKENNDKMILYVMDTGNSDCMLLRTPQGDTVLIDAADNNDSKQILSTLSSLGITKLNGAVATHPHADHIGSMDTVLQNIPTDTVYLTDFSTEDKNYTNMLTQITQKNIPIVDVNAGTEFSIGGMTFTALNPQDKAYTDPNESSIVLLAQYGSTKFLFTGDAEEQAIAEIVATYPTLLDVDVLKVGHHGSAGATTSELLTLTTPQVALIPVGKDNKYGHPQKEVIDLLNQNSIPILRTDRNGDIVVFSDGSTITYKTAA